MGEKLTPEQDRIKATLKNFAERRMHIRGELTADSPRTVSDKHGMRYELTGYDLQNPGFVGRRIVHGRAGNVSTLPPSLFE